MEKKKGYIFDGVKKWTDEDMMQIFLVGIVMGFILTSIFR